MASLLSGLLVVCVVISLSDCKTLSGEFVQEHDNHCDPNGDECLQSTSYSEEIPTLTDLYKYQKSTGAKKKVVKIIESIGCDYYHFGVCILNDADGNRVKTIEWFQRYDSERIVTDILNQWLKGKGRRPESWNTLLTCLRHIDLHTLADDIKKARGIHNSSPTDDLNESSFAAQHVLGREQFHNVSGMIKSLQEITNAIEEHTDSNVISNWLKRLYEIEARLKSGKVKAGVLGLTKAGKSTMLNALLGKSFLPTSVQPQTANTVSIVNNMSTPDGELHALETKESEPKLIAKGRAGIYKKLLELNNIKRTNTSLFYKLILHAPLTTLKAKGNIPLELSDTPGLGEAGANHIVSESELAVKDLCAFVLIVNVQFLKTKSEAELLNDLSTYHPKLFSKLNRVLILVNKYDVTYDDNNPHSLKAKDIPTYVSQYMQEPSVLGKKIPNNHIIPVSAKWALKAREWSSDIDAFLRKEDAQDYYQEATILLRRAGYKEQVKPLREKANDESVRKLCSYLEKVSNIGLVEEKLTTMLYTHGKDILLESTADDTKFVVDELERELLLLKEKENIEQKKLCKEYWEKMAQDYDQTQSKYFQMFDKLESLVKEASKAQIDALTSALTDTLDGMANSKLIEGLHGTNEHEDKQFAITQISKIKSNFPTQALTRMKSQWVQITDTLQKVITEQAKGILADFRNELSTQALGEDIRNSCDLGAGGNSHTLLSRIPQKLNPETLNLARLVTFNEALEIQLTYEGKNSEAISDSKLVGMISEGKKTKYRSERRRVCGGSWFWKDCEKFYVAVSYDVPTYSANFASLQNAFQSVVKGWVLLFQDKVNILCKQMSEQTSRGAKKQTENALSSSRGELMKMLELSSSALNTSRENLNFFETKHQEINAVNVKLQGLF